MLKVFREKIPAINIKLPTRFGAEDLTLIKQEQALAEKQLDNAKANLLFVSFSGATILFSLLSLSLLLSAVSYLSMSLKGLTDLMFDTISFTLPMVSTAAIVYISPKVLYMRHLQREERVILAEQASLHAKDSIESVAKLSRTPSPNVVTKKLSFKDVAEDTEWDLTAPITPESSEEVAEVKPILKPKI